MTSRPNACAAGCGAKRATTSAVAPSRHRCRKCRFASSRCRKTATASPTSRSSRCTRPRSSLRQAMQTPPPRPVPCRRPPASRRPPCVIVSSPTIRQTSRESARSRNGRPSCASSTSCTTGAIITKSNSWPCPGPTASPSATPPTVRRPPARDRRLMTATFRVPANCRIVCAMAVCAAYDLNSEVIRIHDSAEGARTARRLT